VGKAGGGREDTPADTYIATDAYSNSRALSQLLPKHTQREREAGAHIGARAHAEQQFHQGLRESADTDTDMDTDTDTDTNTDTDTDTPVHVEHHNADTDTDTDTGTDTDTTTAPGDAEEGTATSQTPPNSTVQSPTNLTLQGATDNASGPRGPAVRASENFERASPVPTLDTPQAYVKAWLQWIALAPRTFCERVRVRVDV
jgi:hypothetical protein